MRSLLLLLALLLFNLSVIAQIEIAVNNLTSDSISLDITELIHEHAQSFVDSTQLSIALISDENVQFIGIERINDALNLVNNSYQVFEIGSISKVFTTSLLGSALTRNELSLNSRLSEFVEVDSNLYQEISLVQLANHTSGLPALPSNLNLFAYPSNPYKSYRASDLHAYLAEGISIKTNPGEQYTYSNLGVGLLGYLLTLHLDHSYEELLQERICRKYGLSGTTSLRKLVPVRRLVQGRPPNGLISKNWDFDVLVGAGGILSNVEDLSRFAQAHLDTANVELSLTHVSTYKISDQMEIGLGWHIIIDDNGNSSLWHNGGTGGFTSSMTIDQSSSNGVIILSNISAYHSSRGSIDKLCFALLKQLNSE